MSLLSDVKISTPTVSVELPSDGTKLKMRAFRVGDEKTLLMAAESKDPDQIVQTLKQVVSNCVEGKFDVNAIPSFDLEYLFVKLRSFSVGETSDVILRCTNCSAENTIRLDVSKLDVQKEEIDPIIKVNETFGFKMKYSRLEDLIEAEDQGTEGFFNLIAKSIELVYYGDEVIQVTEDEYPELLRIIDELPNNDFKKITEFMSKQPKIYKDVVYDCKECQAKNETRLEGLANFF